MKSIAILCILLGAFILLRSLFFEPTVYDGRKVIERYVEAVSHGNIRLVAFQATGVTGIPGNEGQAVEMDFEGSVECVGDDPSPEASSVTFAFDHVSRKQMPALLPGEHRYVKGVIRFEKATFGWVGRPM